MRRQGLTGLVLAAALATAPAAMAGATPADEARWALGASAINLVYTPAKLTVALFGLIGGGFAGALTGGDTRAAYAIWVPTVGGTWALRSSHFDGTEPFSFWGRQYSDQASKVGSETDGSLIYDAIYD